jgi:potassium-dependent mechanosensitive channel
MRKFRLLFLLLGGAILSVAAVQGQTAPATTNAPPASAAATAPAPAPKPVGLADVVTQAVADTAQLQDIQAGLASDKTAALADQNRTQLASQIDQREQDDTRLFATGPTLTNLRTAQTAWQILAGSLDGSKQSLTNRIFQLDAQITKLGQMNATWQATLAAAKTSSSTAPPEILNRIQAVITAIAQTTQDAQALRSQILTAQDQIAEQDARISAGLDEIKKMKAGAVRQLFTRDAPPLWKIHAAFRAGRNSATPNPNSFPAQVLSLRDYVTDKISTILVQAGIFVIFAVALFWVRRELRVGAQHQPEVRNAAQVLEVPIATAALLALLLGGCLYPLAPRLFTAGLGAAALIPAIIILRRIIEPSLFPVLYALVVSYFVDQVRSVATDTPFWNRILLLLELIAASIFLLALLRSDRLCAGELPHGWTGRIVRGYARAALAIFSVAGVASILGYTHLAALLGNAVLNSSYLAVVVYAAVRIADGLIPSALEIRPLSLLDMTRRHHVMISQKASRLVRWFAVFFWLWEALELFSIRTPLWTGAAAVLNYTAHFGYVALSLGPVLRFGITIWAAFIFSRLLRFVLEEEVYPNLTLGRGIPYAASTMVHYLVLVVGFFLAIAAANIDLSQYAVLAGTLGGALGVGLGFGLQNIMNNFVSGIILLFERPIKVGDMIQVDTAVGTVESIGIRASVIRITNGSEIIMPNGNLISNPVTNWTFSNRQRVIDIPVTVAAKEDPQRVMALLIAAAKANPAILSDPPPRVLLTTFTAAAYTFELRAWTTSYQTWTEIRSDIALAISTALAKENIAVS